MTADNPNSLGSRAHQRMSRINRRISVLPIPTVSNFSKRIHGMTWQAYPVGLGTATGYILLANLKTHPAFLTKIEILLFIMNIIIFSLTTGLMVVQAVLYPQQFKRVALDPNKNSFIPTCVLVFATIIVGIVNYGTPYLRSSMGQIVPAGVTVEELIIFFWIYVTFAISVAITVLTIWFSSPRNPTAAMTPAWAFPVFPLLLTGVVTFNVLRIVPLTDPRAVSIFVTGFLMFGAGAFMCIFYLAIFLLRIMTTGFLDGHQANGAFIAAGPPGFSALILFNMGKVASKLFPIHSLISPNAGEIFFGEQLVLFHGFSARPTDKIHLLLLLAGCVMVGIMLTGCSALLFTMAAIPYWTRLHKHLNEILGCWATTFPNIGLILSLKFLGDTFDSKVFYTFQTILTVMVFVVYLIVLFLTILAIWKGLILMSDDKSVYMDNIGLSEEKTDIEKGGHGSAHAPAHKH
ncbi:hypothetical protein MJO29_013308 [Puccinia striiformis f. sp. tritici]|uniref:hypothetical protein n=1 Tax=Puccinia striiformis f. sp. tritici TaxID=168172 RepID=UPI0020081419|nr:hypothetical protein Pst134EA_025985 [Puccinia striiformis f. sp. tritici]KAH9452049.1 hypothetical protein Pst134EA_025985 [Puccinia striiformis f. sp. tritici]KAI7941234.1 hypothetical protein MJO29_013308 [Puccinia striiformis f. sp. tritici]